MNQQMATMQTTIATLQKQMTDWEENYDGAYTDDHDMQDTQAVRTPSRVQDTLQMTPRVFRSQDPWDSMQAAPPAQNAPPTPSAPAQPMFAHVHDSLYMCIQIRHLRSPLSQMGTSHIHHRLTQRDHPRWAYIRACYSPFQMLHGGQKNLPHSPENKIRMCIHGQK